MKKIISTFMAVVCIAACMFTLAACNLFGGDIAVESITLNKSETTLEIGDSETLTATVTPNNATDKTITWSSDNSAVKVENGKITAVAKGTATVTATASGKSANCTVTVKEKTQPIDPVDPIDPIDPKPDPGEETGSVTLNKSEITLNINGTETLTATVKPDNATNKTVTWTSDKPEIASVDNSGKVKAVAKGTAIITATANGKSAICTVTVKDDKTNKYAEIVAALTTRVRQETKYTDGEIATVYTNGNRLCCMVKTQKGMFGLQLMVSTQNHSLTAATIDNEYYVNAILNSPKYALISNMPNQLYHTDGTAEQVEMVEKMIAKLLGDGYKVMYGTISGARDNIVDATLGSNATFDIDALLEKDGSIFEYSQTLTVTKNLNNNPNYGSVYQAVLKSTESNKDNIYRSEGKTLTDLGEVARQYLAEQKRVAAANA